MDIPVAAANTSLQVKINIVTRIRTEIVIRVHLAVIRVVVGEYNSKIGNAYIMYF